MEPTESGTGNVHLLDIDIADARAIGKRVNAHMISLRRDGDTRSHDNLRADILTDLILGSDPTNGGRGLLDMRVSMTTLAALDDHAAEIPGLGPVIADVARRFADQHPRAEWQATITDDYGNIAGIVTTSRRPTEAISRTSTPPNPPAAFPDAGCRLRTATSTISSPSVKEEKPRHATADPNAATTTSSETTAGNTNEPEAETFGPAHSATPTPPKNRPSWTTGDSALALFVDTDFI